MLRILINLETLLYLIPFIIFLNLKFVTMKAAITSCIIFLSFYLQAQRTIHIVSTNGYTVNITLSPISIVPINSCSSGTFNITIPYSITYTGTSLPSNLFTLQGTIDCSNASGIFFDLPNANSNIVSGTATSSTSSTGNNQCGAVTCSTVHVLIDGPGISSQTINVSVRSLPIRLEEFNVSSFDSKNKIQWSAVANSYTEGYELERSADLKTWNVLNKFPSNRTLDHYEYVDPNPLSLSYYRIKSMDFDGAFIYSSIKSIRSSTNGIIQLYPNPVVNELMVSRTLANHELHLTDLMGRKLATIISNGDHTIVSLSHLSPGMYLIDYQGQIIKFVKS